ncbi:MULTISPECIES: MerR family transcriptional regulator [unclassified Streptomyces]|uniref:helix-turn-helix domain-containing protein n=1 Tax=unclassified Streptomyces TaxID=2593676 RepID=UPI00035FFC85|nr:MerR family transcriptional regulator [Streptomyces sp. BoleA5]MYX33878.1 MerR family transcriptional regulator [Streptomyces sp. SID8377]
MENDGTLGIGELAGRAGVSVKTVRFYSDRGLLPESGRSAGGHRRYAPEALARLRLIRSLRALDLPVPEVARALEREDALEDAVAGHLKTLGSRLAALRWQEAALRLLQDCTAEERAERLELVGAVPVPPSTDPMARFWRRWLLPARLPAPVLARVVDLAVPQPPDEPGPAQVLAFARLHAFTSASCPPGAVHRLAAHRPDAGPRPAMLYEGLYEAYELAAPDVLAGRAPGAGEALDCFVTAHARSFQARDTPGFRRRLSGMLAVEPRIDRYWQLVGEVRGPGETTPGAAHTWLRSALEGQVTAR